MTRIHVYSQYHYGTNVDIPIFRFKSPSMLTKSDDVEPHQYVGTFEIKFLSDWTKE